jgi:uncharacterized protein involved in type VI secretion and phage assembly
MFEQRRRRGSMQRFYGKYRGRVVDNKPDERGRIKVVCPTVMGEIPLNAMPCVPYAGPDVGFRFLPEKEAAVWVEFEGGNPSHPIWTGCFWKEKEFPRIEDGPEIKIIKTAKVTIEIDDKAGSITIEHANGTVFKIEGNDISSVANGRITQQVKTMKTTLEVAKFDVHDGAMTVV